MKAEDLRNMWAKFGKTPFGKRTFSFLLWKAVPYTGSVKPQVLEINDGSATVRMKDRRAYRNHLRSVHALALGNIGELSTGLAISSCIPDEMRFIITNLSIDFMKKARGTITATASCPEIAPGENSTVQVISQLTDEGGDLVSRVTTTWKVGPNSK